MRRSILLLAPLLALPSVPVTAGSQATGRLNPLVDLLAEGKPLFGLYAPSNRRPGGGASSASSKEKSPAELASMALAYRNADFVFDGTMEGDFESGYRSFAAFAQGMSAGGMLQSKPARLRLPMVVKMNEIAPDPAAAAVRIARQLDLGVSVIVFVDVKSADEVRQGLAAMRFRSHGGTRPDDAGVAPARWGMSASEYRQRADLWPLDARGELLNWTIVESREGLAHVREIAAVKGIGVLFPGAGTLRRVFTTKDAAGVEQFDAAGWEAAIQEVLAACKEFQVPCGYPARESDIEMRMRQGFSVFIMGWGDEGFRTVELGRRLSGRASSAAPRR